jgi:hypothetical protein
MTSDRAYAYGRVIKTLNDAGPSDLAGAERDRIRRAVDDLIFSRDLVEDDGAREALQDVGLLCRALVESGRWEPARVTRLADDISQCGPPPPSELKAA